MEKVFFLSLLHKNKAWAVDNATFKISPVIGGRNSHEEHPIEFAPPSFVSSIWHRMLLIDDNKYLEIVTLFHGDRTLWYHQDKGNQRHLFIKAIEGSGLELTWGVDII